MKFLFKKNIHTPYCDAKATTAEDLFLICSHEQTKNLSEKVKTEKTAEGKRIVKKKMFSFYPSIDPYKRPQKISNGIFQFDIDLKDNLNLDMEELKRKVSAYPYTVYAMISPSGGLKFAVQTNYHEMVPAGALYYNEVFAKLHDDVYEDIQCKVGYFEVDESSKKIMQTCILSYDPSVYLNKKPEAVLLNKEKIEKIQEDIEAAKNSFATGQIDDSDTAFIKLKEEFKHLLTGIPQGLDYHNRRPVNFTALYLFGDQGRHIMQSHWIVEDRKKLEKDLQTQLLSAKYHCMNKVRALSENHVKVSNTLLGWNCAVPSAVMFPQRMTVDDARKELQLRIDDFFSNPKTTIIKAPCGIGKSTHASKILADTNLKVLYLSPSHSLSGEICSLVIKQQKNLRKAEKQTFKDRLKFYFPPTHVYGRFASGPDGENMCENEHVRELYRKASVTIPVDECIRCYLNPCRYILQFDEFSNVRFATHNDLRNSPSNWEAGSIGIQKGLTVYEHHVIDNNINGYTDYSIPRPGNWKPDVIVVDEAFLSGESFDLTTDVKSKSLHKILHSVLNGEELFASIVNNKLQLRKDFKKYLTNEAASQNLIDNDYIDCPKKYSTSESVFLKIFFDALEAGCVTNELSAVRGDKKINPSRLLYNPILEVHSRFKNKPILIFDATADAEVYNHIYPDAEFYQITAKPSTNYEVYQCQNAVLSKKEIREKPLMFKVVAQDIADKIQNHNVNKVGLISYKSTGMNGEEGSFVNHLRKQVLSNLDRHEAEIKTLHFGNLRGSNEFNDCDLVFIVGRYQVHENAILGKAQQILGHALFDTSFEKRDQHSRYKEDDAISFSNYVNKSEDLQTLQNAFSRAETIQAIYRARPFTDDPKTVYYYSNASLGSDVSIDKIFDLPVGECYEFLSNIKKVGFCQIVPRELAKLGLEGYAKTAVGRKERIQQILRRGVDKYECVMRRNGKDVIRYYLVTDIKKLEQKLSENCFTIRQWNKLFS